MTTHGHTKPRENIAETMRDVMQEYFVTENLNEPAKNPLTDAFLAATPTGRSVQDLTAFHRAALEHLKPARRKGTATLQDLDSFILWANRFKGNTSAIFASGTTDSAKLICVADYHASGPIDPLDTNGDPTARHCHHRGVFPFPVSDEWQAWMKISDRPIDKDQMGEFIEAQAKDIVDPTPAILAGKISDKNADWENRLIETAQKIEGRYGQLTQLLAMSKRFQVHETSNLTVKTNRDTGEAEIQFLNEHKSADGKPLQIPNLIVIAIPVFVGGDLYRMPVRFRYRKIGGELRFILSIYNPERAFKSALQEAAQKAADETALPLFYGTPET